MSSNTRRDFLHTSTIVGTGLVLMSCGGRNMANSGEQKSDQSSAKPGQNKMGGEVTATEDLMREHGVLRRALLVYSATAMKLRTNASSIAPDALPTAPDALQKTGPKNCCRKQESTKTMVRRIEVLPMCIRYKTKDPEGSSYGPCVT